MTFQEIKMSALQSSTDLQRKVKNIALGSIGLHVIGFLGEILQSLESFATRYPEIFENPTFLSMLIESAIGLIASILLYEGAKTRNKYMLIPFMIIIVVLQFFMVITLFFFGMLCLSGDPIIYFAIAMMVVLITFAGWMLRTTKTLYDDIRKNGTLVSDQSTSVNQTSSTLTHEHHAYNQVFQPTVVASNCGEVDLEGNLQVNIPSFENVNEDNPDASTEQPPAYNETSTAANNDAQEFPPSYDEAMKMRKQRVDINEEAQA